jgi:lipoprotein-releasing system ATP-binding protein
MSKLGGARTPLIAVEGLKKSYPFGGGSIEVLRGVDLAVDRGEMLGVVGVSGAGKSTLLHILGALDRPTAGTVRYGGNDLFALSELERAAFRNARIGFVFQFHHLLAEFSILENTMMPSLMARRPHAASRAAAEELLVAVGLKDRLRHKPGELAGGEQQRVAVARALVNQPDVVLADEPTGNLDRATGGAVHDLLRRLSVERNQTFVVVTHNEALAAQLDRVVRIEDGVIVEQAGVTHS